MTQNNRAEVSDAKSREEQMVVIERDADGKPTVWCDPEIVDLVRALNAGGIRTVASCSGHGQRPGVISLADGRELIIAKDYDEARHIERMIPVDINGEPAGAVSDSLVERFEEAARKAAKTTPVGSTQDHVNDVAVRAGLSAVLASHPEPTSAVQVPAIHEAMQVLNLVILAGTSITEGQDGSHSSYTPLAEAAKKAWEGLADHQSTLSQSQPTPHDLYKTGDPDAPDVIKDRNGEVVLDLCRRCGKGEIEISGPCEPAPQPDAKGGFAPCPFCGQAPKLNDFIASGSASYVEISCVHPVEEGPDGFDAGSLAAEVRADTAELAVAAWNRRSTPPTEAGVEEPEVVAWIDAWEMLSEDMPKIDDGAEPLIRLSDHNTIVDRLEKELADLKHDIERAQSALSLEATARVEAEEAGARLREAFQHADDSDWEHLFTMLHDTERGRFWKSVMSEARAALRELKGGE